MLRPIQPRPATIAVVMGTRPEAIKLAPVVRALRSEAWARTLVVGVRQHRELLDRALTDVGLALDVDLEIKRESNSLAELTARLLTAFDGWLERESPDAMLVQGDTTSALTGALAAFYRHIPVAHIEAGLRSGDVNAPFPEEANRRMIASLATWHFAPTMRNRENMLREGTLPDAIAVTGNTIVDALQWTLARDQGASHAPGRPLLVVSLHRREGLGEPQLRMARAIRRVALAHPEIDVWFSLHPNPAAREPLMAALSSVPNVVLAEPVRHGEFLRRLNQARLALTDSGGVLEEAASLGVPCLIARETTERNEAVELGAAELVGFDEDRIVSRVESLLAQSETRRGVSVFGDGHASERIVAFLREHLASVNPVDQFGMLVED